ncbi:TonB family protein [Paraburkholderia elongata]|uniref:TonB family protein n=1 Tax=Paraburkholderia elongata TaxID=2675747 RepID=A0A972NRK5_9BURK|nr:TonB family protein [Paraburkholderia elongata]NPT57781.1 TonB family protein [Paraburkholderia elongata]
MATISVHVRAPERRRIYLAAAFALVVEAGVLAGAYLMLTHRHVAQAELPATVLTLAPAAAPTPAPAAQPAPQPQPVAHPPQPVHRAERVVTQRPVVHAPAPVAPPKPDPAPTVPSATPTEPPAVSHPAPPPPVAAPATPATPGASFEAALRAAIQSALHYPESARMGGITGRTRVAFEYRDGLISDARVVVSSGVGLLDRAALAAVRDAVCPKPESAFAGKTLSEQLWVTFNLNETE